MKCRYHPDQDAVAVCQKFGYGYCTKCCSGSESGPRCSCSSPETHCKFRQECLVHYATRRMARGEPGIPSEEGSPGSAFP